MKSLLEQVNKAVNKLGGQLSPGEVQKHRKKYNTLTDKAALECPPPDGSKRVNKLGRMKRSKARNLLEHLIDYEDDVLRLMGSKIVPFTNNRGENDIRRICPTKCFGYDQGPAKKYPAAFGQWTVSICFIGFVAIFRHAENRE